jgi:protein phosphatase
LLRGGQLEQLTKDHTLTQLLIDCGELTDDEATDHPARSQLTRFVGMPADALPQALSLALAPGDRLLLCSDGLSGLLSHEQIQAILTEHPVPENACRQLVASANAAGGSDNITALVIEIGTEGSGITTA